MDIKVADPSRDRRDDSILIGVVNATSQWQEIRFDLSSLELENNQAAGVVFDFAYPGESGVVYIDDINFKKKDDTFIPESVPEFESEGPFRGRGLWVWETRPLLEDDTERQVFFDFCHNHGVQDVFLQVIYDDTAGEDEALNIETPEAFRAFLREATNRDIEVHALGGAPALALKPFHHAALEQVEAIKRFNEASRETERFKGIRMDIEPYVIPAFEDSIAKIAILTQWLALNKAIADTLTERDGLEYGVDIPFWLDTITLEFEGVVQTVDRHIIDIVDNVGIMDYRRIAPGRDGMIQHGMDELLYAQEVGTQVFLGAETSTYTETIHFNLKLDSEQWMMLSADEGGLIWRRTFNGFGLVHFYPGDGYHYLGLGSTSIASTDESTFNQALFELRTEVERTGAALAFPVGIPKEDPQVEARLREVNYTECRLIDGAFVVTARMLPKITFANRTKADLDGVLDEVNQYFRDSTALVGFAIHHYQSYRDLPAGP